ncbi:MAG: hypothetical protein A3H96_22895 [Acidobacteria bacterium RIFCSPLOWO2_02_FULL_67_36]|nr:MAG: hypothetical protein A3H96_22895 [Acidobacteria bacterium RIFCSPLOWO2_02_FULL_67_36]OFW26378.1 MAG: hypothetical protein A3G21_27230 [Acidobacteria bacterium RIFCSPLOWO2_12_FULL_66_21]
MWAACAAAHAQSAAATPHDDTLSFSGYLQPQYERIDRSGAEPRDRVFFRRMVLIVSARPTPEWAGTILFDLAPASSGGSLVIKDAFLQYVGWKDRGLTITFGNQKLPFSRAYLVAASRRGLVERPFPGDRSVGSPGRAIAVKVDQWNTARTLFWSGALASSLQSPDPGEVRVDGIAEARPGWSEGVMAAGRVEWHPLGETPRGQGAFGSAQWRVTYAVAGYVWRNDGDITPSEAQSGGADAVRADASAAHGIELSTGLRGHRVSLDAEYERIAASARDRALTAGLYADGEARLHKAGVEAGYMVRQHTLEIVAGADLLAADAFGRAWTRASAGLSWYAAWPTVRFQMMERVSRNDHGVSGAHSHATYVQAQFAF